MSDLKRTQIGSFNIKDAISIDTLNTESIQDNLITL